MHFYNDSTLANAGIYRQTLENIMFTPAREIKKKEFHDETLASIKKVTKMVEKFENGRLEVTVDEILDSEEEEELVEPVKPEDSHEGSGTEEPTKPELSDAAECGEDFCDGPTSSVLLPPTPKTRTKFTHTFLQGGSKSVDRGLTERTHSTITETPILRSVPRKTFGSRLFENKSSKSVQHLARPIHHFYCDNNSQSELANTTETPILRTSSRQVSGASLIDAHIKTTKLNICESPSVGGSRQKTFSSGSSGSSAESESSTSTSSSHNSKTREAAGSGNSFNANNQDYYCKFARAQVHNKFSTYFKWNSQALRSIAATVSKLRLDILNEIPIAKQTERMVHIRTIYENCIRGVNKEMDALCCALFDLLDDMNEKNLSIHEEYVAVKYRKKCEKNHE